MVGERWRFTLGIKNEDFSVDWLSGAITQKETYDFKKLQRSYKKRLVEKLAEGIVSKTCARTYSRVSRKVDAGQFSLLLLLHVFLYKNT